MKEISDRMATDGAASPFPQQLVGTRARLLVQSEPFAIRLKRTYVDKTKRRSE